MLVLLSAFYNGNNIGTMGLDEGYLELLTKGPFDSPREERESYLANHVLPLRRKGLQLLVSILTGVSIANSAISIFLAEAEGDLSGFFISTTLTLIFGEMLPQAVANRYPLEVAYYSRFLLYTTYYLLFLVTFPVSAVIGKVLGEDAGTYLNKSQMKKLFEQYEKDKMLKPGERKILSAALELKTKTIGDVMTPIAKAFMLDVN